MTTLSIAGEDYELVPFGMPPRDVPSWKLYGGTADPYYVVMLACRHKGEWYPTQCDCGDFENEKAPPEGCKHIVAVREWRRNLKKRGTVK